MLWVNQLVDVGVSWYWPYFRVHIFAILPEAGSTLRMRTLGKSDGRIHQICQVLFFPWSTLYSFHAHFILHQLVRCGSDLRQWFLKVRASASRAEQFFLKIVLWKATYKFQVDVPQGSSAVFFSTIKLCRESKPSCGKSATLVYQFKPCSSTHHHHICKVWFAWPLHVEGFLSKTFSRIWSMAAPFPMRRPG